MYSVGLALFEEKSWPMRMAGCQIHGKRDAHVQVSGEVNVSRLSVRDATRISVPRGRKRCAECSQSF